MAKIRIDKLLVEQGMVNSRQRACALIMAGKVLVNETAITKAGERVEETANVRIKGEDNPFVSRGGLKMEGALNDLNLNVEGKTILDVGASTGGFTDCCLQRGATHVYAVDVGTNQLAYSLRCDARVTSMEQINARGITPSMFPAPAQIAVIDVSFISITKLLKATAACLTEDGQVLAMVKPQFEVGKEKVGKGGVVRSDADRQEAVNAVVRYATSIGLTETGRSESKLPGPKGNLEIFVLLEKKKQEPGQ